MLSNYINTRLIKRPAYIVAFRNVVVSFVGTLYKSRFSKCLVEFAVIENALGFAFPRLQHVQIRVLDGTGTYRTHPFLLIGNAEHQIPSVDLIEDKSTFNLI